MSPLQQEALKQIESIDHITNVNTTDLIIRLYADLILLAFKDADANGPQNTNTERMIITRGLLMLLLLKHVSLNLAIN